MAVSDESAGGTNGKRRLVRLTEAQWQAARFQYESGELKSFDAVASAYGISPETVRKKSERDTSGRWQKGVKLAQSTVTKLRDATDKAITIQASKLAERIGNKWERDLAPWIEKEKRLHIRDSIKRSKSRQKLLDSMVDESDKLTPKDVAFIARSDDTYDQIKRRNLGMSDGASVAGALNVNILTGSAAVQFAPAPSQ